MLLRLYTGVVSLTLSELDRFVRFPTGLLEALLRTRLSGVQWRILLWVVRYTFGWNRQSTPFTWYRIAQELALNRSAVYRSGQALLAARVLVVYGNQLGVQMDCAEWDIRVSGTPTVTAKQLWMPGMDVAIQRRPALLPSNAGVACRQPNRSQEATLSRRAKDSSKERLKTYIRTRSPKSDEIRHRSGSADHTERGPLAGAAKPVPGKYDGISQN